MRVLFSYFIGIKQGFQPESMERAYFNIFRQYKKNLRRIMFNSIKSKIQNWLFYGYEIEVVKKNGLNNMDGNFSYFNLIIKKLKKATGLLSVQCFITASVWSDTMFAKIQVQIPAPGKKGSAPRWLELPSLLPHGRRSPQAVSAASLSRGNVCFDWSQKALT